MDCDYNVLPFLALRRRRAILVGLHITHIYIIYYGVPHKITKLNILQY